MRAVVSLLLTGLVGYLALVVFVYFYQARLLYFPNVPGRELEATPQSLGLAYEELSLTTADNVKLHGWFVPAADNAAAVILCHGNAGNISHRLDKLRVFHDLGLAVLLFDYRGYGRSEGEPDEEGTYRDARAAWDYLTTRRGVPAARIVIVGESMGGPVAAHLAQEVRPGALILASTFTSATNLAARFYWYLPVRLIAKFRYPTVDYVARVRAPVLVIHSRDDEIVPFAHGEELFSRAAAPTQFLEIFGDHNAGFTMSGPRLAEGLREFLVTQGLLQP